MLILSVRHRSLLEAVMGVLGPYTDRIDPDAASAIALMIIHKFDAIEAQQEEPVDPDVLGAVEALQYGLKAYMGTSIGGALCVAVEKALELLKAPSDAQLEQIRKEFRERTAFWNESDDQNEPAKSE